MGRPKPDRVLVLAPHTDDGELGCGGSICRFIEEGAEVFYTAFSIADKSLPPGFLPGTLRKELGAAMRVLGVPEKNTEVHDFEVRTFSYHRQEILERVYRLRKDISPDTVLMPSTNDVHQDHQVIAQEAVRVFKTGTLLGYEEPWNNLKFDTACFVPLEERHVSKKIEALACYETQRNRSYSKPEFIRSLAIVRGTQINKEYAEAYDVVRLVLD
jgi:LmbE family N-acetylglucosaminyl deacetylase